MHQPTRLYSFSIDSICGMLDALYEQHFSCFFMFQRSLRFCSFCFIHGLPKTFYWWYIEYIKLNKFQYNTVCSILMHIVYINIIVEDPTNNLDPEIQIIDLAWHHRSIKSFRLIVLIFFIKTYLQYSTYIIVTSCFSWIFQ